MYLTPAQLIDGSDGAKEFADLFVVEPALLAAVVAGEDTSAWPADSVARAVAAQDSVVRFIAQAVGEVDARLTKRGYPLPQDATRFPVLSVWTRSIARYHLHRQRDRTSEETGRIERDYRDALRALDFVAEGKLGLGAGDPLMANPNDPSQPGSNAVRVVSQPRLFSRRTLGAL